MRVYCLMAALMTAVGLTFDTPPAQAGDFETPPPKPTILKVDLAQQRVQAFLKTLKNLPPDVLVLPGTGVVPWPGAKVSEDVKAEVWTAVAGNDPSARPFLMFAVRPDTGDVFVLYLRKLEPPTAARPR